MIDVKQSIYYFFVALEHCWLEEVGKLYVLADDLSAHLKDLFKGIYALKKDLGLIHNQLEPFVPTHCELSFVSCLYLLFSIFGIQFWVDLAMKIFDLVLKDLRVVVADVVYHLCSLLKYVRVSWITYFEELVLLLNKYSIVDESPSTDEV